MPRTKHFNEIIFPEELSVEAKAWTINIKLVFFELFHRED